MRSLQAVDRTPLLHLETCAMIAAKIVALLPIDRENGPVTRADSVWSERAHECMVARTKQRTRSRGPLKRPFTQHPKLPKTKSSRKGGKVILAWIHPAGQKMSSSTVSKAML